MAFENTKRYSAIAAVGIVGIGGLALLAEGSIDDCGKGLANFVMPSDVYEFDGAGLGDCLPDIKLPGWLENLLDKLPRNDDTQPYTSKVEGAITKIEITPLQWPLFDRIVTLNPLEIKQAGDVEYQETTLVRQNTAMVGRLAAITVGEGVERQVYVMAVDGNGTEDPTDDSMVPINVNDFDMVSSSYTNHTTFDSRVDGALSDFQECNELLLENKGEVGGCTLAGTNDYNKVIQPVILDNIRDQYKSDETCTVDTMHIMSNLVLGGETSPDKWRQIVDQTVTVSEVSAASLDERMASLHGVSKENTHIIMELDPATGKPVEWDARDTIDLSRIEELSGGEYESANVYVDSFCFNGSWSLDSTPAQQLEYIKNEVGVGKEFFDPKWYEQFAYEPEPMPEFTATIQFNQDGTWTPGAAPVVD